MDRGEFLLRMMKLREECGRMVRRARKLIERWSRRKTSESMVSRQKELETYWREMGEAVEEAIRRTT